MKHINSRRQVRRNSAKALHLLAIGGIAITLSAAAGALYLTQTAQPLTENAPYQSRISN